MHIHHLLNKDHPDANDESNLVIVCPNCHAEIHGQDKSSTTLKEEPALLSIPIGDITSPVPYPETVLLEKTQPIPRDRDPGVFLDEKTRRACTTFCLICDKPFYKKPHEIIKNKGRTFCSQACYKASTTKEIPCAECGEPLSQEAKAKRRKTCGDRCAAIRISRQVRAAGKLGVDARQRKPIDQLKGWRSIRKRVLEMRGHSCECCGYDKASVGMHVHHIAGVHIPNPHHPDNLVVLCPTCHAEAHYAERREDVTWAVKSGLTSR